MYTTPYRDWFSKRIDIADSIFESYKTTGEADAQIILCCAIGTLSAMRWPGINTDKRRFIEFLTRFTPQTQVISVPLLIESFFDEGDDLSANKLIKQFLGHTHHYNGLFYLDDQSSPESLLLRNLDSNQIDQTESDIGKILSKEIQSNGMEIVNSKWAGTLLDSKKDKRQVIREASYAARIYTDFRCGLVHSYHGQNGVTSSSYLGRRVSPIYANLTAPLADEAATKLANQYNVSFEKARINFAETKRRLYFPYEYIRDLMKEAADNAFADWEKWDDPVTYQNIGVWSEPNPSPWWITKYGK